MRRYRIPITQQVAVTRAWVVFVEADTQADAVALLEGQLADGVEPDSLRGVEKVLEEADDFEEGEPCEVQAYDITEGPCAPDPRQTTLF